MKDDDLMREVARAMRSEFKAEASVNVADLHAASAPAARVALADALVAQLSQPAARSHGTRPQALWSQRAVWGAVALAACFSLASTLYLRSATRERELPAYASNVVGGVQTFRHVPVSAADTPLRLGSDATVDWVLRPARPVKGPLVVHLWYRQSTLKPLPSKIEVSAEGSVHIVGQPKEWQLPPGRVTLYALVERLDGTTRHAQPTRDLTQLMAASGNQARLLTLELELSP